MAENVFILGAGFSAPAGAPLINNFLKEAFRLYEDEPSRLGVFKSAFHNVYANVNKYFRINNRFTEDLLDIEKLYSLLDFRINYLSYDEEDVNFKRNLILLIIKTLETTIKVQLGCKLESNSKLYKHRAQAMLDYSSPISLYQKFALISSNEWFQNRQTSAVITFNYDLILDNAFESEMVGGQLDYCLGETFTNKFKLLKLHGSSNWMTCSNPKCEKFNEVEIKDNKKFLGELHGSCPSCKAEQTLLPLIVPPSWDKTAFRKTLKNVWKQSAIELSDARRIFIIGYSFIQTDLYFKSLLQSTISFNENMPRIYIVNNVPIASEVMERFRSLFSQTYYNRNVSEKYCHMDTEHFIHTLGTLKGLHELH